MGENRGPRRGAVHFDGADHPTPVAAAAARLAQWDTYHPYPATSCHGVPRTEAIVSIITICSHQRGQAWPDCQTGVSQKNRRNRDSRQATTISVSIDGNRPFDAHDAFLIPRMLRAFKPFELCGILFWNRVRSYVRIRSKQNLFWSPWSKRENFFRLCIYINTFLVIRNSIVHRTFETIYHSFRFEQ